MSRHSSNFLTAGMVAGLVLSAGAGCGRTAHFTVTRPALLNASAVGNTMTVGGINHNGHITAAAEITSDLQNRIAHSLNPSIRLLAAGGGVVITGAILADDYAEAFERSSRTCTRQVQSGTDSRGTPQYRTESYTCTDIRRIGTGVSRLQFTITNGTNAQVLFAQNYENSNRVVTVGIESPYENRAPDPIDGAGLVHTLRAENVDHFARVILPWRESVSVDFEDCDGDNRCRQGFDLVQQGNLQAAEALFTQVIGQFERATVAVPPDQAERIGEAFYNRGVTRSYMGTYARSVMDLQRAIALRPNESDWPQELTNAQQYQRDQEALRQQGEHSNAQQNVQQAGAP